MDDPALISSIKAKTDLIGTQFTAEARRVVGSTIYAYVGSTKTIGPVSVIDDARQPIDLTGRNLKFCLATKSGVPLFEYDPDISGSSFSVDNLDASVRSVKRDFLWSLRDADDGTSQ